MANPVVHFEIIGPDPGALRRFYSALFGWDAPAGAPVAPAVSDEAEYSFIQPEVEWDAAAGGIGGGPAFTAHTIFYVGVADVRETLQRARELGATVTLEPTRNEGGAVTIAQFTDPGGNLIGIAGPG